MARHQMRACRQLQRRWFQKASRIAGGISSLLPAISLTPSSRQVKDAVGFARRSREVFV